MRVPLTTMMPKNVVLVTGGSRGIGLAVVKILLQGTADLPASNVVSLSRSAPAELAELAEKPEFKESLAIVKGDVTKREDNDRAVKTALDRWNRLDALVLNAGIAEFNKIADLVRDATDPDHGANDALAQRQYRLAHRDDRRGAAGPPQEPRPRGVCEQRRCARQLCVVGAVQVRGSTHTAPPRPR